MTPCDCESAVFGQHSDECIANKMAADRRRYRDQRPMIDKLRTAEWYERQGAGVSRAPFPPLADYLAEIGYTP